MPGMRGGHDTDSDEELLVREDVEYALDAVLGFAIFCMFSPLIDIDNELVGLELFVAFTHWPSLFSRVVIVSVETDVICMSSAALPSPSLQGSRERPGNPGK